MSDPSPEQIAADTQRLQDLIKWAGRYIERHSLDPADGEQVEEMAVLWMEHRARLAQPVPGEARPGHVLSEEEADVLGMALEDFIDATHEQAEGYRFEGLADEGLELDRQVAVAAAVLARLRRLAPEGSPEGSPEGGRDA